MLEELEKLKFEVCEEMQKLRDGLDGRNIPWEDVSSELQPAFAWICRTHFEFNGTKYSVINGFGTYGGISLATEKNEGLLEMMGEQVVKTPIGYLTAEQILRYIDHEPTRSNKTIKSKQ